MLGNTLSDAGQGSESIFTCQEENIPHNQPNLSSNSFLNTSCSEGRSAQIVREFEVESGSVDWGSCTGQRLLKQ